MAWQETVYSDRIDPHVRPPKEPARFPSAQEAFDAGNYPVALDMAREDDPAIYAMALIMGGAIQKGLTLLENLPELSSEARKVRDYACWCLNQDSSFPALASDDPEQPIDVLLVTMPGATKGVPFKEASGFNVISVELTPDQFGTRVEDILASVSSNLDPKLALVIDCFGPYLPEGLFDAGFPVAIWVADHDYFLPLRHRDLSCADILVCNSASEHSELARCYSGRVAAIPGHDTYAQLERPKQSPEDPIWDIFFSGRAFVPYMRDKAQQLFQLATVDDEAVQVSIVDGYFPDEQFAPLLRTAKNVPLFWRYGGGLQTRAADVLRQGRAVLSPESGLSRDYLGKAAGAYHVIGVEMPTQFEATSGRPEDISNAAEALFWPSPAREERLLKFCLFQSLFFSKAHSQRAVPGHLPVEQRGYPVATGVPVYTAIMTANMRSPETAAHFNAAGCAGFYGAILSQENQKLGQLSLQFFQEGTTRFPANAALRFNQARALQVFGQQTAALEAFKNLSKSSDSLDFSPDTDALLSHRVRVLAEMFNYGEYYRLSVDALSDQEDIGSVLRLIESSVETYLGQIWLAQDDPGKAVAHLDRAIQRDPLHVTPQKVRMECLDVLGGDQADILNSFYTAVNLYPPILLTHASYGVLGELALDRRDRAEEILKKFVLLYARTSDVEGSPLGTSDTCKHMVRENRDLLNGWIGELADQMMATGTL